MVMACQGDENRNYDHVVAMNRHLVAEIERLREALEKIARVPSVRYTSGHMDSCSWCNGSEKIAREALNPTQPE